MAKPRGLVAFLFCQGGGGGCGGCIAGAGPGFKCVISICKLE